jgi:putative nucleotidyltransferase with HDIG domain
VNVLIVDDEPQVCQLIQEELAEYGFSCQIVTEPLQARSLLNTQQFGLLIADIAMPRVGGLDLLAYVKQHLPACKVILITGVSTREYMAQAILLGAYDYIEKPFKTGELAEIVSRALSDEAATASLPARAAEAMEYATHAKQASLESIRALARAVEAKDPHTRRHSEQVTHYAVNLARELGLPEAEVECIRVASLLHDVGKIGVPDNILTKPGPLTDQEFEFIRRHPALGADILANITVFGQEAHLVRYHHERWDGKGYPEGLAGEKVPLGSRIIQVADCMDAMLMDRVYKRGYPVERMLAELERCAGTQFDPRLAAVAAQWCRTSPDKLVLPGRDLVPRLSVYERAIR